MALRKLLLIELIFPIVLLIFGIYHGLLQFLYRAGIIRAESFLGIGYYQGLTAHGVINAIVLTTFFAVAFGNALIPSLLGRPISSRVAWISGILMIVGTLTAAVPIFTGQASVLYTFYPPLKAHPAFYIGVVLLVVGSWVAFFNWIPVYIRWRKDNPGKKTPLGVLGMLATFTVWQIATLPVAYEVLVLLLPWSLGWTPTVNVVMARTLFWFFGHPLVYFWIMPAYVMYYTMLPRLVGGKLFSDFGGRLAFLWLVVFSSPLGLHHQFTEPGLDANWKLIHSVLTFLVAVPSIMTAFILAASMEHGARTRGGNGLFKWWSKLPYMDENNWLFSYMIGGLALFVFGGITGIVNASYNMNRIVHNTAWLPAHFHMTVAGPVFLSFIGMSLMMVSQLRGRPIKSRKLAIWTAYFWTLGVFVSSTGAFIGGIQGLPRRTNVGMTFLNPASQYYQPGWVAPAYLGAAGGVLMTLAMVLYFYLFFATAFGKATEAPRLEFPTAEPLYDEDYAIVRNMKPWVVAAVVAVIIAYTPTLIQIVRSGNQGSQPYSPGSPIPLTTSTGK